MLYVDFFSISGIFRGKIFQFFFIQESEKSTRTKTSFLRNVFGLTEFAPFFFTLVYSWNFPQRALFEFHQTRWLLILWIHISLFSKVWIQMILPEKNLWRSSVPLKLREKTVGDMIEVWENVNGLKVYNHTFPLNLIKFFGTYFQFLGWVLWCFNSKFSKSKFKDYALGEKVLEFWLLI